MGRTVRREQDEQFDVNELYSPEEAAEIREMEFWLRKQAEEESK